MSVILSTGGGDGVRGRGGGMHGGGACVARGHAWQGCVVGEAWGGVMHGRRDGYCSGLYASYWNAFLLKNKMF